MLTLKEALSKIDAEKGELFLYRSLVARECPKTMKALGLLDAEYTLSRRPKGYNLVKRDNKKLGFVYYVRYWHEGRMLPSKWCTGTNDPGAARVFAEKNRGNLIEAYTKRNDGKALGFFESFFDGRSEAYRSDMARNGDISEGRRKRYASVMSKKFIPFLKERKIIGIDEITGSILDDFQDILLARGLKPQSVNDDLYAVRRVFGYLARKGMVRENPCLKLNPIPKRLSDKTTHGCYDLESVKGVFNRRWKNKLSYLLDLLVYTTGMRNGEIRAFGMGDIVCFGGCHFIDIKKSKTRNGIRLVPLHETVYKKIALYAAGKERESPVFGGLPHSSFAAASADLGAMLKKSDEFLKENNITYYSGRHFWKTLMNANGLGEDAEEVFMGHKVSSDVSKLYNHREAQGETLLVKKAREIFRILDKRIFADG